jgi:hypothetical protein
MSQSSITAAALIIAFLIFITVRGELPAYLGAFGIGAAAEGAPGGGLNPGPGGGGIGGCDRSMSGGLCGCGDILVNGVCTQGTNS